MATGSLYGSTSESTGLYGIGAASGGTYFEWFIFQDSATAPANPTGGSWSFSTNTGVAPTGWVNSPPPAPVNQVWVSIAVVDSRNVTTLVWSTPGLMTGSGLPILSASGVPSAGTGMNGQLYINTATTPQSLYFKQSGAWTQLTGSNLYATAGANSNITSLSGLTGGISTPDFVQFDTGITPTTAVGKLQWDPTHGGLQVGMTGGHVNLQIGQEEVVYVFNDTGAQINEGQVVKITGSQGQRVTVALAQANNDGNSATILGMATENIANNSSGFVTTQGIVNNINTNGFADGTVVYLSPTTPGGFTATKPVAPNHMVLVGYIVKGGSGGAGSIFIHPQNGYELSELHDVLITSVANNNLLRYNSAVPAWVNIPGPSGTIVGTSDTQTLTNKTISGSSNTLTNIPNSALVNSSLNINGVNFTLGAVQTIGPNWILPSYVGNAGKVLAVNPSASDVQWVPAAGVGTVTSVDVSGGTTGLTTFGGPITAAGTITLGGTLAVANGGTGATNIVDARANLGLGTIATQNANSVAISGGSINGTSIGASSSSSGVFTALSATSVTTLQAGTADSPVITNNVSGNTGLFFPGLFNLGFSTSGSERMRLNSVGNLGIGTVSPTALLDVNGTLNVTGVSTFSAGTAAAPAITTTGDTNTGIFFPAADTIAFSEGGVEAMRLDASGNMGIGKTNPATRLDINTAGNSLVGGIRLQNGAAQQHTWYLSTDTTSTFNIGSGAGTWTWANSGGERMRLDSSGRLGIGTTNPLTPLVVSNGNNENIEAFTGSVSLNGGGFQYINRGAGASTTRPDFNYYLSGIGAHKFYTNDLERMRLDASGNLGIGTTSPAARLDVAANGETIRLRGDGTSTTNPSIRTDTSTNPNGNVRNALGAVSSSSLQVGYVGTLSNHPLTFFVNDAERARIDASGNLGIGTTTIGGSSTNRQVTVSGSNSAQASFTSNGVVTNSTGANTTLGYIGTTTNHPFIFTTNNAERMRLETGGTVLIGATSRQTNESMRIGLNGVQNSLLIGNSAQNNGAFLGAFNDAAIVGVSRNPTSGTFVNTSNRAADIIMVGSSTDSYIGFGTATAANTAPTERMRLDSNGNLGLGVTPSAWPSFVGSGIFQLGNTGTSLHGGGTGWSANNFMYLSNNSYFESGTWRYYRNNPAAQYVQQNGQHAWFNATSGTAGNAITFAQAMTLDASGNLLVGATAQNAQGRQEITFDGATAQGLNIIDSSAAATSTAVSFIKSAGTRGTITVTASATAYNTSSDYRLKNITGPVTNSGAYIDSLNPVEGTWKADGSTFVGLIAHEVQEASRTQVATGVKDGEQMQGMDYSNSELIANLIAEVKSLRARVAALESI